MRARHLQHGARLGQLPPLRGGQVRGDGLAELLALRPGPAREPAARRDHRLRRLRPRQLLAAGPLLRDVPRGLVRARPRDVPAVRAGHVQRRRRRDGVRQVPERPLPVRARAAALRGLRGGPRRRADGGQPAERPVRRLRRGQGQRRRRARLPRVRGRPEPARVGPRGVRGVRGGALRAERRPDLLRELPHRGRRALERAGRRGLRRVRARLLLRQPDVPRLPLVGDVPAGLDARQPLGRARGLLPLLDGHAGHLPLQALVWKSNFGRPSCLCSCVCAMAWNFQAIDATLSPWPRRLDGVEVHKGLRNNSHNRTHWLISTQASATRAAPAATRAATRSAPSTTAGRSASSATTATTSSPSCAGASGAAPGRRSSCGSSTPSP